jgi:RNA polymerase sigma-70 factor (ECF subfamily)
MSGKLKMPPSGDSESLLREIVAHQDRMFRYIFSLCPADHDARDILQETCVALLRNAKSFDNSRPFLPWAYRFAQLEVLKHRERVARCRRVFDADVIELLARQRQGLDDALSARLNKLGECLEALEVKDRQLINARYSSEAAIDEIATRLGINRRSVFRNLQRIRRLLLKCIVGQVEGASV